MITFSKDFRRLFYVSSCILLLVQFTLYCVSINLSVDSEAFKDDNIKSSSKLSFSEDIIELLIDKQSHKNEISTTYRNLLQKYSLHLNELGIKEKCQLYFSELYQNDPNWSNGAYKDSFYDSDVFNKNYYFLKHKEELIQGKISQNPSDVRESYDGYLVEDDYLMLENNYREDLRKTLETEQKYVDAITNSRVFSRCYLSERDSNDGPVNFNDLRVIESLNGKLARKNLPLIEVDKDILEHSVIGESKFQDIESRVFPFISGHLPIYLRWNGDTHWGIPNINSRQSKSSHNNNKAFSKSKCFLQNFKDSISDKGIVITGSDREVEDIINLIRLLRGLDNELPIQIIHRGDISRENQHRIIRVSRKKLKLDKSIFAKIPLASLRTSFRKQEIWFVNVSASIKPEYLEFFGGFYMKFLAYFFSSFEEIILLDSDAVPLIKPSDFFNSSPYKKSNTIFFKDRSSVELLMEHDVVFFKKLLPTIVDETIFGIPKSTSKTLSNNFFAKKYKHSMEAGLIGINKKKKFNSILSLLQLQVWTPANRRVWGDKELFWLSLSIVGDENYEFNKHDAVSVGSATIEDLAEEHSETDHSNQSEYTKKVKVCSSHPGHISGDDDFTLLWFNSGFKVCKKQTWQNDIENVPRLKEEFSGNVTLLKEYYKSNMKINNVLLPSDNMYKKLEKHSSEPSQEKYKEESGWKLSYECGAYNWCASEFINEKGELKNSEALLIEYDSSLTDLYDYYGKLWVSNNDLDGNSDRLIEVG
ncbi:alpha-1,3-mannosyltransferase [Saccharomycopsis crataegensis]|uniref:Alpha-1,3-mannosyltransferase n=1 Tax=Saccharomycopsis crataegensis TaxID=43959 RepID=A0AAV5QJB9_9ASCO|nr:alpha-1,3-mannosyltransferase [Saccharomycopsis crataegensis]